MENRWKETTISLLVISILIALVSLVPFLSLTAGRGLELTEYFDKVTFYWALIGAGSLIMILLLNIFRIWNPNYRKFGYLGSAIHSPQYNEILGKNIFFRNAILLTLGLVIVFGTVIWWLSIVQNIAIGDLPIISEQVTETANFLLSLEPPITSEGSIFWFPASLILFFSMWYLRTRNSWNFVSHLIVSVLLGVGGSILGIALHSFRYAGSEASIQAVAIFWFVLVFLSCFLFSMIPLWTIHYLNNGILKLKELAGTDFTKVFIPIFLIILVVIFILYYNHIKNKKVIV